MEKPKEYKNGVISKQGFQKQLRLERLELNERLVQTLHKSLKYHNRSYLDLTKELMGVQRREVYQLEEYASLVALTKGCIALWGKNLYKILVGEHPTIQMVVYYHESKMTYTALVYRKLGVKHIGV